MSSSSTNPSQGFWQKKEPSVFIQVSPFGHISDIVSIKNQNFIWTNRVAKSVSFQGYRNNNSRYTSADLPADWVLGATRFSRVTRRAVRWPIVKWVLSKWDNCSYFLELSSSITRGCRINVIVTRWVPQWETTNKHSVQI